MPAGYYRVKGKRKTIKIGDKIQVRETQMRKASWEPCKVYNITDIDGESFYWLER